MTIANLKWTVNNGVIEEMAVRTNHLVREKDVGHETFQLVH